MSDLERMRAAIVAVYFAAYWTADRDCDEAKLWIELREAAGITPGQTRAVLGDPRGVRYSRSVDA